MKEVHQGLHLFVGLAYSQGRLVSTSYNGGITIPYPIGMQTLLGLYVSGQLMEQKEMPHFYSRTNTSTGMGSIGLDGKWYSNQYYVQIVGLV